MVGRPQPSAPQRFVVPGARHAPKAPKQASKKAPPSARARLAALTSALAVALAVLVLILSRSDVDAPVPPGVRVPVAPGAYNDDVYESENIRFKRPVVAPEKTEAEKTEEESP